MSATLSKTRRADKPAAICLGLGLATLAACGPANALTFNWSFLNNNGTPSTGGTITGTISGLAEGINDVSTAGITVNVLQSQNVPIGSLTTGADAAGSGTITVLNGNVTDYNFNIIKNDNSRTFGAGLGGGAGYVIPDINDADVYNGPDNIFGSAPNPVPGPLPLLGASAAFAWSRRLRQRQRTSLASLRSR